jgi:Txe/YoeB family toxin of Txe-Axe toxin-antitoxin module
VPKIHLGIICGNEADYITRFLDSFQPHVDSISVVRAIGNQPPDASLDIAKARGCIVGEYFNAAGNDWPHVDSFCAARNASFALAPADADWLMWADCDDLLAPTGAQVLAEIRAGKLDAKEAVYAPYVTSMQGSYARRIRLVHREVYDEWINCIHEDIEVKPNTHAAWCQELQVVHMPAVNKRGSVERNKRILTAIPEAERTGREWWFLFRECEMQGDISNYQCQSGRHTKNWSPWQSTNVARSSHRRIRN